MSNHVDFAYVWREEQDILARLASEVPENGVIVEVGTALGGTAFIMWNASRQTSPNIHTVDLFACPRAKNNLAETDVCIINESSIDCAARWDADDGRPVDLLYIDGDHTLAGIHRDFAAWAPKVRPGGQIAFHDYDPPRRGHVAHLGVGVYLDTVNRLDLLDDMSQEYKMCLGKVPAGVAPPSVPDCFETLCQMGRDIQGKQEELFSEGVDKALAKLRDQSAGVTSLQAAVLLEHAIQTDFEAIDTQTSDFHAFRRNLEVIQFLDHAYGEAPFPARIDAVAPPATMEELSALIAAIQVRVSVLAQMLRTLVDWDV